MPIKGNGNVCRLFIVVRCYILACRNIASRNNFSNKAVTGSISNNSQGIFPIAFCFIVGVDISNITIIIETTIDVDVSISIGGQPEKPLLFQRKKVQVSYVQFHKKN